MKENTVSNCYGNLTQQDKETVTRFHKALLTLSSAGIPVNTIALKDEFQNTTSPREMRTLDSIRNRLVKGRIHPRYDLFKKSGRSFVYQEFPNLSKSFPISVFDFPEGTTSITLSNEDPISSMKKVLSQMEEGYELGPIVGTEMYLIPA